MKRRLDPSWSLLWLALAPWSLGCSTSSEAGMSDPGAGAGASASIGGSSATGGSTATAGSSTTTAGSGSPPDLHSPTFTCAPDAAPPAVPLRRLSSNQLKNTLRDVIGFALPKSASAALQEVGADIEQLPADSRQGPDSIFARFDRLDQTVQQRLVDDQYALARRVGAALTNSSARLTELVGECVTKSNDQACLDAFIQRFGERVQRRALESEDVTFYRKAAGSAPYAAALR
jgi:hypothetical protein